MKDALHPEARGGHDPNTRYVDGHKAGFDAHARLDVLDREGIDVAVVYCGLAQCLGGIRDRVSPAPDRLIGTGYGIEPSAAVRALALAS